VWLSTFETYPPPQQAVQGGLVAAVSFLDDEIGPAARAAGVDFHAPTTEELFLRPLPIET
jgi:hypothetical protein